MLNFKNFNAINVIIIILLIAILVISIISVTKKVSCQSNVSCPKPNLSCPKPNLSCPKPICSPPEINLSCPEPSIISQTELISKMITDMNDINVTYVSMFSGNIFTDKYINYFVKNNYSLVNAIYTNKTLYKYYKQILNGALNITNFTPSITLMIIRNLISLLDGVENDINRDNPSSKQHLKILVILIYSAYLTITYIETNNKVQGSTTPEDVFCNFIACQPSKKSILQPPLRRDQLQPKIFKSDGTINADDLPDLILPFSYFPKLIKNSSIILDPKTLEKINSTITELNNIEQKIESSQEPGSKSEYDMFYYPNLNSSGRDMVLGLLTKMLFDVLFIY